MDLRVRAFINIFTTAHPILVPTFCSRHMQDTIISDRKRVAAMYPHSGAIGVRSLLVPNLSTQSSPFQSSSLTSCPNAFAFSVATCVLIMQFAAFEQIGKRQENSGSLSYTTVVVRLFAVLNILVSKSRFS